MKTSTPAVLAVACLILVASVALAARGEPPQEHAGEWSESGTLEVTLNGRKLTGRQVFATRFGPSAAQPPTGSGCNFSVEIEGEKATVPSGYSCTIEPGNGATLTLIYRTGTFTLNGDSMTHHGSGDARYVRGDKSMAGTFRYDSTLVRVRR